LYHVLIISDNRIVLKQVYELLMPDASCKIHVLPSSVDAYEEFYRHRIDIVILDSDIYMSYRSILDMFSQCQWNYKVILLIDEREDVIERPEVFLLEKSKMNQELIKRLLLKIQTLNNERRNDHQVITMNWKGELEFVHHQDAYSLILIRRTRGGTVTPEETKRLIDAEKKLGTLQILTQNEAEAVFSISRSDMKLSFNMTEMSRIVFREWGSYHAVFYLENINSMKIKEALEALLSVSDYSCFMENGLLNIADFKNKETEFNAEYIRQNVHTLIEAVFDQEEGVAGQVLGEIYLHILKEHPCFVIREQIRLHFMVLEALFGRDKDFELSFETYGSLEEEMEAVKQYLHGEMKKIGLELQKTELVKNILLAIVDSYSSDISLDGIASLVGFNKIYVNRIFKETFGRTVLETLQIYRMQTAKFLLLTNDYRISEIAQITGYQDAGYFGKNFKKHIGITPQEFRIQYRGSWERRDNYESIMAVSYRYAEFL